ncbi:hypothetical protein JOC59_001012 [Weissella beninensis]|uniref:Uncharacterized protein n=1 Tax=Periweissella beninensis TaxID=504936 RepID=A0ABT0VN06_9LACO|nr:hypothetical protein [Periweissella beninensis]MBM7544295.1 hypothetical protein [Periweissella beninensis]MCM2437797.1 hypothetical protein [Periweissella beninensis]
MSIIKSLIKHGVIVFTLVGIFFGSQQTINYLVTPKHPIQIKVSKGQLINMQAIDMLGH